MKEIDAKRRDIWSRLKRSKQNVTQFLPARLPKPSNNKENADDKIVNDANHSLEVKALDAELAEIDAKLTEFTITLPNIPLTVFLSELMKRTMEVRC